MANKENLGQDRTPPNNWLSPPSREDLFSEEIKNIFSKQGLEKAMDLIFGQRVKNESKNWISKT